MLHSWKKLTALTDGKKFLISRVTIPEDEIQIEGNFQLPPLAELSMDDQIFTAAFIKTHGSIKQMEAIFGISYPTVKNRLNSIGNKLDIVDVAVDIKAPISNILDKLEQGEIDVQEALKELE
ncbi:MAG: DUF2089 domain-containing protein [Spirochaetales bacterium]|nr:DUF2089 domain-containing protein [Spirochaetales bacterium]